MRLGIVVNDLNVEEPHHDAVGIAHAAIKRGHDVCMASAQDLACQPDGHITAVSRFAKRSGRSSTELLLRELQSSDERFTSVALDQLDAVIFRSDPSGRAADGRPIGSANVAFGRLLADRHVLVLNDPCGTAIASSKLYLQHFPERCRPDALISRDPDEIKTFASTHGGRAVIKPISGSSGRSVFLLRSDDCHNANQMIETVLREGHVVAQEYIDASDGDVRVLCVNGRPLRCEGRYAAVRRVAARGDFRNNGHKGGQRLPATVTQEMIASLELLGRRLISDGLFLVGVDVASDKVLEINVLSPGGLGWASMFEDVDFFGPVVAAIEEKIDALRAHVGNFDNAYWATF